MKRLLLLTLFLMLTACGGKHVSAPVTSYTKGHKPEEAPVVYSVKKGDTLYSISWRYGVDYKTLAKINNIKPPYTIYKGQKLRFKSTWKSKSKTTSQTAKKTSKNNTKKSISTATLSVTWRWPTSGTVISTFSKTATGRKGINIAGKSGQRIIAAAAGKVVYSGNGLARYGNLLIIKHNDSYLSAYAHNKALYVKEGQWVKSGQKIAALGRTGTQRDQLHFEIRRNGEPVDPLKFLPKR
jgi:lipoprotein NlpD